MKRILLIFLVLFGLATTAHAQPWRLTGGTGWTPASQTYGGLRPAHWYKADGTNYQDTTQTTRAVAQGDVIGYITDYGTGISGVSQPTTDNKPILRLNAYNGKPAWWFDGANDYLNGTFGALMNQPVTVFVLAKMDAAGVNDGKTQSLIDGGNGSTYRMVLGQYGVPDPDTWRMYAGTILSGSASNTNTNIWTAIFNGAASQYWLNGISDASGNAGAKGLDSLTVGCPVTTLGANSWCGDIAEIIIYGTNLSTADKNQVGHYMARKYGITYTAIP